MIKLASSWDLFGSGQAQSVQAITLRVACEAQRGMHRPAIVGRLWRVLGESLGLRKFALTSMRSMPLAAAIVLRQLNANTTSVRLALHFEQRCRFTSTAIVEREQYPNVMGFRDYLGIPVAWG